MNTATIYKALVKRAASGNPVQPDGQAYKLPPPITAPSAIPPMVPPEEPVEQKPEVTKEENNKDLIDAFKQLAKTVGTNQEQSAEVPMDPAIMQQMPPELMMQQPKIASYKELKNAILQYKKASQDKKAITIGDILAFGTGPVTSGIGGRWAGTAINKSQGTQDRVKGGVAGGLTGAVIGGLPLLLLSLWNWRSGLKYAEKNGGAVARDMYKKFLPDMIKGTSISAGIGAGVGAAAGAVGGATGSVYDKKAAEEPLPVEKGIDLGGAAKAVGNAAKKAVGAVADYYNPIGQTAKKLYSPLLNYYNPLNAPDWMTDNFLTRIGDKSDERLHYQTLPEPKLSERLAGPGGYANTILRWLQNNAKKGVSDLYDKYTLAGGAPRPEEYNAYKEEMKRRSLKNSIPTERYADRQGLVNSMPQSWYLNR